jgi:hypothetical protein
MSGIPPPGGPDVHTGEKLLAIQWSLACITAIALALRSYTTAVIQRKTRISEIIMWLAFVSIRFFLSCLSGKRIT